MLYVIKSLMKRDATAIAGENQMKKSVKRKTTSYILKGIVVLAAVSGIWLSAAGGRNSFMGGSRVFMYFTIQSNLAIALICAAGGILMLRSGRIKDWWFVVKFVGTVSITLTGAVFCFVLAPTFGPKAWSLQNILTHVIVPVAAVADFFVTGIYGNIRMRDIVFVTLPPLAYVIYAGIGYACGWEFSKGANYPYFFLNWGSPAGAFGFTGELPYMGCVWWIGLLLIGLLLVGAAYLLILKLWK